MRAEPVFARVISSVADGEGVDWRAVEESTRAEDERQTVADLQLVAEIAKAHRLLSRETRETQGLDGLAEAERTWGDLEIVDKLGEGAFGEVFLARDTSLNRLVALKLLRPEIASRPGVAEQLLTEARTLAKLHHPNVVTIHGAATEGGRPGFWMEYIEGETLEDRLAAQGPFGADEAGAVGRELCRALAAVHKSGLIHRDIKARNVVRERGGRLVLMDFGAGISAIRALDPFHARVGTPIYLAPETLAGASATPQTDLYALGVLLYHLVTGRYPYQVQDIDELRQAQTTNRHIPLHDLRPDLPSSFVDVVERALAPAAERVPDSRGDGGRSAPGRGRFARPHGARCSKGLVVCRHRCGGVGPDVVALGRARPVCRGGVTGGGGASIPESDNGPGDADYRRRHCALRATPAQTQRSDSARRDRARGSGGGEPGVGPGGGSEGGRHPRCDARNDSRRALRAFRAASRRQGRRPDSGTASTIWARARFPGSGDTSPRTSLLPSATHQAPSRTP